MPSSRNLVGPVLLSLLLCPAAGAATEGSGIGAIEPLTLADGSAEWAVFSPHVDSRRCLWRTDGTAAGTMPVAAPGDCVVAERRPALVATHAGVGFFVSEHPLYRFWRTDGTAGGTWPLTTFHDLGLVNIRVHSLFAPALGLFFFDTNDGVHGTEPWVSDGSREGARLLADLDPGPDGAIPSDYVSLGSHVLFFDRQPGPGGRTDLWRTDGTPEGTALVARVGTPERSGAGFPHAVGDRIVFWAFGACETELWTSDGTAAGTQPVALFAGGGCRSVSAFDRAPLSPLDHGVLFTAEDGEGGVELWRTDGTAPGTVRLTDFATDDPFPDSFLSERHPLAHAGRVYFAADDGTHGLELWSVGPGPEDASLVADLCPGPCSSGPDHLLALGDRLVFVAGDPSAGRELWASDGTAAGTERVADLCPGACDAAVRAPTRFAEALLFVADDGSRGEELWILRPGGAPARLTDLAPASPFQIQLDLVPLDGRAVFTADDDLHGRELWVTDGTAAGTHLVVDLETAEVPVPPAAPANLAVEELGGGRLRLTWEDRSDDETRFVVESLGAGESGWSREVDVAQDTTSVERVFSTGSWRLRVRAARGSVLSPPSNEVEVEISGLCAASPFKLCLGADRFAVSVEWYNQHAGPGDPLSGAGTAVPAERGDDSGYFWFFTPDNLELVVKVLDGTSVNGHFWVFRGGLTDVEHWITVEDTETGLRRTYHNPPGQICGGADTAALPGESRAAAIAPSRGFAVASGPATRFVALDAPASIAGAAHPEEPCQADDRTLCLLAGRLAVSVDWSDHHNGGAGIGHAIPSTDLTGFFWFFDEENVELVVKALDGTTVNGRIWVFYGALTDVGYTIRVEDRLDGHAVREYTNPPGTICGRGDTEAF